MGAVHLVKTGQVQAHQDVKFRVRQPVAFDLAEVVDHVDPYGCIMAGDVPPFWMKKKKGRRA